MKSFIISIIVAITSISFAKEVALTIDDAPRGSEHIYAGLERTHRFIDILEKTKIHSAFFCNPFLFNQDDGKFRLQLYSKAGHTIANHTYSHPSLNKISVEDYISGIDEADRALNQFSTFKRWFRFPFLEEGSTIAIRDRVRFHLKETGYINAYVTVDNYDYVINEFVQNAFSKKLKPDLDKACEMLSDLNLYGLEEQEKLAQKYIGKSVRQVLLMHENDIEAFCLERSIQKLKESGWQIISPEDAFADPTLSQEPNTLWLEQGRIAAIVAANTGIKYKSKWESTTALNKELKRRQIVKGLKAD